jgi:hypothetical protein
LTQIEAPLSNGDIMKSSERVEVTPRDRLLLEQAHTDLLTVESAHRHHFSGQNVGAVHSTLRRLYGKPPKYGLLRPYPLDSRRKYYRLTQRGARLLGVSRHHTRPLNQQGKVQRYTLSWLMHIDSQGERTHFSPRDHPDKFHLLENRFPHHPFFIEERDGAVRLGCVIVDHNALPQNAARKTVQALQRFLLHGWFDVYIKAGLFSVHLMTFDEQRRRTLRRLLALMMRDRLNVPLARLGTDVPLDVQVRHVPGMKQLLDSDSNSSESHK